MRYSKTIEVMCNGHTHLIRFESTDDGRMSYTLLDHSDAELNDALAMIGLGQQEYGCFEHYRSTMALNSCLVQIANENPESLITLMTLGTELNSKLAV